MEDLFGINAHRKAVANNIQKALGAGYEINDPEDPENEMQKARVGVYADTVENRRLNRVGQAYGHKKQEEMPKGKVSTKKEDEPSDKKGASEKQDMSGHAAKASDGALKRAAADEKAPEDVRNAAKEELKKRGGSEDNENLLNEDGSPNKDNPIIKRALELDKKLGEHPDKNSDEYKELASIRERFDYETAKMNNEKMLKIFPNFADKNFPSFEEWKKKKEEIENDEELNMKLKRQEEKEAKEEKKQEDFDDISSDIDSIAWYMADNPEEDESGNKYEYKDGDIQNEVVKKFGTKIRKIVEKYGKGETISLIAKHSETFDRIRSRRLVNACLKSE